MLSKCYTSLDFVALPPPHTLPYLGKRLSQRWSPVKQHRNHVRESSVSWLEKQITAPTNLQTYSQVASVIVGNCCWGKQNKKRFTQSLAFLISVCNLSPKSTSVTCGVSSDLCTSEPNIRNVSKFEYCKRIVSGRNLKISPAHILCGKLFS